MSAFRREFLAMYWARVVGAEVVQGFHLLSTLL